MTLYRILLGIRINKYLKEMEKIKEKAASLLQKCEVVVLSSINAEGYPRPVPIARIASEGLSTIWMSTGASSLKTTEFRANAKAGLCYYSDGDKRKVLAKLVYQIFPARSERSGIYSVKIPKQPSYNLY